MSSGDQIPSILKDTNLTKSKLWAELTVENVQGFTLKAEIMMVLPPGAYKAPDLSSLCSEDTNWLKDWLIKSGLIRRGDTGEDMIRKAKDLCSGSAFFIPDISPSSPKMRIYTYFFALAVFMDDLIEGKNLLGREKGKAFQIANLGGEIILGKYEKMTDLPEVYPIVMPIFRALFIAAKEAREVIFGFDQSCADFVNATNESFAGMALMQLDDTLKGQGNDIEQLPEDYFKFLRRYDAGCEAFIELAALIVGITLPPSMKQNLLFRRVISLACSITAHVNDLFGVRTDVEKGEGYSLVLFKAKRMTLKKAFEEVNIVVLEQTRNFVALVSRLRMLYPKNKRLDKYLRVIEHLVDGHVHYCTINAKYGNVRINFVERNEKSRTEKCKNGNGFSDESSKSKV